MSSHDLNSNPVLVKQLIKQYQDAAASARQCPDSVLPAFERELHQLGFQFEVLNQAEALLPKHKKTVLPIVMKYYALAKNPAEKNELLRWLHHRGFEEAVPMLLVDYYSDRTPDTSRWFISDTLFDSFQKVCAGLSADRFRSHIRKKPADAGSASRQAERRVRDPRSDRPSGR